MKNWPTRPTTDRAREALFNILNNRIILESSQILELFGGTGAHAIECVSRGCTNVTYVEKYFGCVEYVKKQAAEFGISDHIRIVRNDVRKFIKNDTNAYDYVFADPPYDLKWFAELPDMILSNVNLSADFLVVIEHDSRNDFKKHAHFKESRKYGDSIFSFFS